MDWDVMALSTKRTASSRLKDVFTGPSETFDFLMPMSGSTSDYILKTSREYSIYVCANRAIPSIADGLKHGQRIALWLMKGRAEKLKTSALSGLMAYEGLYVHGEVSANNAIGLLAAPYKNNVPLIVGLGQFGSRVSPVEGIGAPRYTEVQRSKAAELILYRDLDLIPLADNYDGSNKQPWHFLPLIPTVLLNGVEGVAVGWSTSILPRSLKDLIQATIDALKGKTLKTIPPYYEHYDIGIAERGPNQWEYSGKVKIIDTSTVHISELPPGISIEKVRKDLIALEDTNDSPVVGFIDKSTENIDITVQFKRGWLKGAPATTEIIEDLGKKKKVKIPARPAWKEDDVLKYFKLIEKVTERIVVIDWGNERIKTYENAEKVVESFANWRLGWYTARYNKLIQDAEYELNYWKVLRALFRDGFTSRLGKFANRAAVEDDVTAVAKKSKLTLDKKQMDRVVSLPTYRWTKEFADEVEATIKEIEGDLTSYRDTLADPEKLKAVYIGELEDLKKKL
jgi:DNA gyrase/topoisomerase IV subunit A